MSNQTTIHCLPARNSEGDKSEMSDSENGEASEGPVGSEYTSGLDLPIASTYTERHDFFALDQLPLLDEMIDPVLLAAINSRKRKRPASIIEISDSEAESYELPPPPPPASARHNDDGSPLRTKKRNPTQITSYTPHSRGLLRHGRGLVRERVLTENAFPSADSILAFGRESWENSRASLPELTAASGLTEFDHNILQVVTGNIKETRARIKNAAMDLVVDSYLLTPPLKAALIATTQSTRKYIRDRVEMLQRDSNFIRGSFGMAADGIVRQGVPFAHPILSSVIYRAVYAHTPPLERVKFDPMPLALVALAATAVLSALDDWCTGRFYRCNFSSSVYNGHYQRLLLGIKEFQIMRPHRCAALMVYYTRSCKSAEAKSLEGCVLDTKLRVYNTDSEDDQSE